MSRHFVDKENPELGYYQILETGNHQFRWVWRETAKGIKHEDYGPIFTLACEAYRDASYDWESNGDNSNRRLSGHLRAAATRIEKEEA